MRKPAALSVYMYMVLYVRFKLEYCFYMYMYLQNLQIFTDYIIHKLNRLNSDRIENTSVCQAETCTYTLYHVVKHAIHFKMHERCPPKERHQKKNTRTQTNQKKSVEVRVTCKPPPPLVVLRRVPCVDLVSTFGRSRGRSHAMFIYGILVVYHSDIHGSFRSACTAHLPSF